MRENWQGKFLWELLEMEAPTQFYVNNKEHPAFLLFPRHHWASREGHTLYMNGVGVIDTFGSKKKALERLTEIIETANFPVKVQKICNWGRNKGKPIPFAENKVQRVDMTDAKGPCKTFEIQEWST